MELIIDEEKIIDLLETEWGYEGIREEVSKLLRENGTPIDKGDLIMFNLLMTTIADKGLPFEEVLLLIDNAKTPAEGDCISRSALKEAIDKDAEDICGIEDVIDYIDNAPTVPQVTVFTEDADEKAIEDMKAELQNVIEPRPQGECKTCIHRDPEDKKCDCGGLERQGCPFPVSDDYFCKFYEKGGVNDD